MLNICPYMFRSFETILRGLVKQHFAKLLLYDLFYEPPEDGSKRPKHVGANVKYFNTLRTGSFKLFKRPLPGFLTILTL